MTQTRQPHDSQAPPRTSTLQRAILMRLAEVEYERFATTLVGLRPQDWSNPTDCPGWDVRAMAGHVLGMAEMAASLRETRRQQQAAQRRGGVFIDALTAHQVETRAHLSRHDVIERFQRIGPRAARARRRTPGLLRRRRMPVAQWVGGQLEEWTLGFLLDTILTRDPWMHRIDIARATGRAPHLTPDHDAILVADVVAEWAARHGRPVELQLTGPAGGSWSFGIGTTKLTLDAIDFCRTLSRREPGTDLLATEVPF